MTSVESKFPYALIIEIPLPTHRLALSALRALQVDAELSPLVRRNLSLNSPSITSLEAIDDDVVSGIGRTEQVTEEKTVLRTEYQATTNRMLRVAVNGFMESLGVVLQVMEELDVDVLEAN